MPSLSISLSAASAWHLEALYIRHFQRWHLLLFESYGRPMTGLVSSPSWELEYFASMLWYSTWRYTQISGCTWACMHVCMCVFLSIGRRTYAIAAACLFSLAIFSCWPCQGPQNYPPTVGSSGLQCIGLLQTWVINLCHLFIHLTKHTCSPPLLPTTPDVSKIHTTQWT